MSAYAALAALPSREELKKRRDEMVRISADLGQQIGRLEAKRQLTDRLVREFDDLLRAMDQARLQ